MIWMGSHGRCDNVCPVVHPWLLCMFVWLVAVVSGANPHGLVFADCDL